MALGDSLKSFIKKQFIDVIQWTDQQEGVLASRFPMQDMEIQNGGKLTVRESQAAMFVNEGRCADIYGPGLYTLNTQNMPVLTNLMNWDKMFESPFKSDVFFFTTRQQLGQRWGTTQPITIRDKDFGMVRVRGYGVYSWHIENPKLFLTNVSGFGEVYRVAEVEPQLRQTIVGRMSDAFAESKIPFLDMAANLVEVGDLIKASVAPIFAGMGIALDQFVVENLSLPEELQKLLDTRIGNEHDREHAAVHAVPGRQLTADRRRQRGRWAGEHGCRARRRPRPRPGFRQRAEPPGAAAGSASAGPGRSAGCGSGCGCRWRCRRCRGRRRDQVLHELRIEDSAASALLRGMRNGAAVIAVR